ncbi:phosphotransferase [Sessilibacter sp. MAH1]
MTEPLPETGAEFEHWIKQQLVNLSFASLSNEQINHAFLSTLTGDAGFRRYFRVNFPNSPITLIAAACPATTVNTTLFHELSESLNGSGVSAPQVIAIKEGKGWLLLEDFGDDLLLAALSEDALNAQMLYAEAAMTLVSLQLNRDYDLDIESYSPQKLKAEMALFETWFIEQQLGLFFNDEQKQTLKQSFDTLIHNALVQPQVLVHRDYHSRNLIVRDGLPLGVIDFQDAVWGPITYDLVSLFKDCYVRWQPEQIKRWALNYRELATDAGLLADVDETTFMRWFDLMGLQRHIKVLGIFARLNLRDAKSNYLNDLTRVFAYTLDAAEHYSELASFADLLRDVVLPAVELQPWYNPDSAKPWQL